MGNPQAIAAECKGVRIRDQSYPPVGGSGIKSFRNVCLYRASIIRYWRKPPAFHEKLNARRCILASAQRSPSQLPHPAICARWRRSWGHRRRHYRSPRTARREPLAAARSEEKRVIFRPIEKRSIGFLPYFSIYFFLGSSYGIMKNVVMLTVLVRRKMTSFSTYENVFSPSRGRERIFGGNASILP